MGSIASPSCECLELRLGRVGRREDVAEQVLAPRRSPHRTRVLAGEDLHRHERVEALLGEDASRPREIDVGRVARQDLVRRPRSRGGPSVRSAPLVRSRRRPRLRRLGSGVAASVAYGSRASTQPGASWPHPAAPSAVVAQPSRRAARSPGRTRRAIEATMLTSRPWPDVLGARPRRRRPHAGRGRPTPARSPVGEGVARLGQIGLGRRPHSPRAWSGVGLGRSRRGRRRRSARSTSSSAVASPGRGGEAVGPSRMRSAGWPGRQAGGCRRRLDLGAPVEDRARRRPSSAVAVVELPGTQRVADRPRQAPVPRGLDHRVVARRAPRAGRRAAAGRCREPPRSATGRRRCPVVRLEQIQQPAPIRRPVDRLGLHRGGCRAVRDRRLVGAGPGGRSAQTALQPVLPGPLRDRSARTSEAAYA